MTGRTERRVREIRRRTRQYRKRHERRVLSTLSVCSLLLFAEIGILLRKVQSGGVPTVADSYGSVLLRGGASAYIVVGIAAFAVGVTAVSYTHLDVYKRQRIPCVYFGRIKLTMISSVPS